MIIVVNQLKMWKKGIYWSWWTVKICLKNRNNNKYRTFLEIKEDFQDEIEKLE